MDKLDFDRLKNICNAFGFTQKGKTFFRIVGDGVLQVVKSKYQRRLGGDIISVGLLSMYSYLQPQWITATGSITRYSIIDCFYQTNMPLYSAIPVQTQLDMLNSQVLPWLNSLGTQKKLICAVSKLDPRWNDRLKIGPYLACGEINHAKKVLREVLANHDYGRIDQQHYCEKSNGVLFLKKEHAVDDPHALMEMISRGDLDEIDTYLKVNFTRNMKYVKFCIKDSKKP